ncbi:metallophosphoesterase [Streptomyces phage ZooBear]|uniref:Metallophosphoesterase n=2 Tax=Immanueltrevirus immanuel3 TaxID=2846399 RepID=A0A2H5BM43_9CAUD|nr:metallophosphoesterase [Streptomyces phage HaugeAnator]AUG87630.1 metallophosphoesterase [Streptomyces phage ZooBear]
MLLVMATKTTVILPDIQYPFHDALALSKVIKVIKDIQPDHIFQIGDAIDFPQVSRWTKGTAGEYAPTLQKHIDGFKGVLAEVRDAAPKSSITWLEGNHDLRIKDFVTNYAAPLTTLRALEIENLFGLAELGVKYTKGPVRLGTNTYAVHGHESGGYSASASAWQLKFFKRYGSHRSIVFGHTHQPFLMTHATGFDGKVDPRFVMNVGSVMDPTHAKYVKDGSVSWVMSFGLLRDDGKRVYPELVTMVDRGFWFNGTKY